MNHWLTRDGAPIEQDVVKRFDPLHWTIDFPRGAMASAVLGDGGHGLTVRARFTRQNDLVGLIWTSADGASHRAHARETSGDYSHCTLKFRWQSSGLIALDAINGPTLTIEGRDALGAPATWLVRLWNYASGTPTDAVVTLNFDALNGGFALPADAVAVHPKDIDRMFVSLVPPGYAATSSAFLASPVDATLTLSAIACDGSGSVLAVGDSWVPEHDLRIASSYDDQYHLVPERVVAAIERLGHRGIVNHYIGMSHYMALGSDGLLDPAQAMCAPARAWHEAFAAAAKAAGFDVIWSLSYEILDPFCPAAWKQRSADGAAAATGYDPPSTLVSPASSAGIAFLGKVAETLVDIAVAAGLVPRVQIGEPWWWVTSDHRPCLYDDAARAALGGSPPVIADVRGPKSAAEKALLDQAGALLASSTASIAAAARARASGVETLLLVYLPGPLDPAAPEMRRANLPLGWSAPAFDVLQLEDYEWVTGGRGDRSAAARASALARLGYAAGQSHYFSGFVRTPGDAGGWDAVVDAAVAARSAGHAETFLWALPQVLRDSLTLFGKEAEVAPFDDVLFPIAIGAEASVSPGFSTEVVTSAGGHEVRNANWRQGRLQFDAGPGVRDEAELGTLIAFFRARRGPAGGFRFTDPFDHSSNGMTAEPGAADQALGSGDGTATRFPLVKRYGAGEVRRITRPVAGSIRVSVGASELVTGWTLAAGGVIQFDSAPAAGAAVKAGYRFDVPVRFAEDELAVSRATFRAGESPSVPLVEVRE